MKKLFTLAAAVLFTASMFAATETVTKSTDTWTGTSVSIKHDECANGSASAQKDGDAAAVTYIKFRTNKNSNTLTLYVNDGYKVTGLSVRGYTNMKSTDSNPKQVNLTSVKYDDNAAVAQTIAFPYSDGTTTATYANTTDEALSKIVLQFDNSGKQLLAVITITYEALPATTPVTEVIISGGANCFVGKKVALKATPDVNATNFKWSVDGVEQAGAESETFEFAPAAAGTFAIKCSAKNANNSDWVESAAHNVVAIDPYTRTDVTAATTWDFSKASAKAEIQFTASTDPKKDETCLLANVDDVVNDANFNSQAMEFAGEFVIRNSTYSQGKLWQFKTTVAGWVKVWFSNTGTKDDPRYVAINEVVNTTTGSKNETMVETPYIAVEAGDVKIEGSFDPYNVQYLRISKIVFRTTDPTAIDNTEAEVKTVKTFENGQLIIIKNGVKYNAQGAVVR